MIDLRIFKEYLNYDKDTGLFSWAKDHANYKKHEIAGSVTTQGYISIFLLGKAYRANRLAWYYYTGSWPINNVDHIDKNRANNKISNLRDVTQSINVHNSETKNVTGHRGVYKSGSKFTSRIMRDRRSKYLGTFLTAEEASAAYNEASKALYPEMYEGAL